MGARSFRAGQGRGFGNGELRQAAERGFTLLELLVAITVLGVTAAIALPSMTRIAAWNRLTTSSNQILQSATNARLTAVTRNQAVGFCAGARLTGCHGDWRRGETITFIDRDRDGILDADDVVLISNQMPMSGDLVISGNGPFRNVVIFRPSGLARTPTGAFAAGRLRICVKQSNAAGNAIDLVLIGSGRIEPMRQDFDGSCPTF